MKRNIKILGTMMAFILITAMMLSACGTGPSAASSAASSQAPAQTSAAPASSAAAPASSAAASTEAASPAAAAQYKLAVVGPGVHVFYTLFPTALKDVAKDLGLPEINLQFPQKFDQNQQNAILDGLVANGYNGIAMQPSDSVAANEKITELKNKGIILAGFGAAPEKPTDIPFVVATDVYTSAVAGATKLFELMGGKGSIVHLTGGIADANTKSRIKAIKDTAAKYPDIKILQDITDIDTAETAQNAVNNLMGASREKIDGIICTAYNPTVAVASVFTKLNETRIKVVGIDTDEAVLAAIKAGFVTGTMAQNPYAMAYISVYGLKLQVDGKKYASDAPFNVDSGTFFVNKDNVGNVNEQLASTTKDLLQNFNTYFK